MPVLFLIKSATFDHNNRMLNCSRMYICAFHFVLNGGCGQKRTNNNFIEK